MKRTGMVLAMLLSFMAANTTFAQKYLGGDISLLPSYEAKKAIYYDKNGKKVTDVIAFLKEQGMNSMRVRLFVDPSLASAQHKQEGVVQNLEYVKALGKRIKDAGLHFLLDFHYSDTWTDPAQHSTPAAWQSMTAAQLATQMYTYTKESLEALKEAGAEPDAIQVGNELNLGQLWDTGKTWPTDPSSQEMTNFVSYVKNAVKACREVCPKAKVVFHVAMNYRSAGNSNNNDQAKDWTSVLKQKGVDYDVFGLSYYPYYHGALTELESLLKYLESNIADKEIQIVEAGYPNAWYPSDAMFTYTSTYPATEEGQRQFTAALVEKLNVHNKVTGLYWWYPEANGNYFNSSSWYNMGLWNNSNHRALKALYELKSFLPEQSAIDGVIDDRETTPDGCYNLMGQHMNDVKGLCIINGKKVIRRKE